MQYSNFMTLLAIFAFLSACGGSSTKEAGTEGAGSFNDFRTEATAQAGTDAVECGTVEVGESQIDANSCVANAFANRETFVAFYKLQGIDSEVASAIVGNARGEVSYWLYDSNPSGGIPASPSRIDKEECKNATLSGSLDTGYENLFICAE